MRKLNASGISKILPFIQNISSDVYGDRGPQYVIDGDKIVSNVFPTCMIEEIIPYGLRVIYDGRREDGHQFKVYVEDQRATAQDLPVADPDRDSERDMESSEIADQQQDAKPVTAGVRSMGKPGATNVQQMGKAAAAKTLAAEKEREYQENLDGIRAEIFGEFQQKFMKWLKDMEKLQVKGAKVFTKGIPKS